MGYCIPFWHFPQHGRKLNTYNRVNMNVARIKKGNLRVDMNVLNSNLEYNDLDYPLAHMVKRAT